MDKKKFLLRIHQPTQHKGKPKPNFRWNTLVEQRKPIIRHWSSNFFKSLLRMSFLSRRNVAWRAIARWMVVKLETIAEAAGSMRNRGVVFGRKSIRWRYGKASANLFCIWKIYSYSFRTIHIFFKYITWSRMLWSLMKNNLLIYWNVPVFFK